MVMMERDEREKWSYLGLSNVIAKVFNGCINKAARNIAINNIGRERELSGD